MESYKKKYKTINLTTKLKQVLGLLILILSNFNAYCSDEKLTGLKVKVISKEINSQNGTLSYELILYATDTVIIDSIGGSFNFFNSFSNNGSFPVFLDSTDSLSISIT
jgi:hypothetical protein